MDEKKKRAMGFIVILILLALLMWWLSRPKPAIVAPPQTFQDPFNWPNGIYPGGDNMWGGSPFDSTINVNVSGPGLGWLATQYMPAFGLVGVAAYRGA